MTVNKSGRHIVYLSIGSNLGDKKAYLDRAVAALNTEPHIAVNSVSGYYQTEPQNYSDQDWFVNAAVKIETDLDPDALLGVLTALESGLDKKGKPFRFGPRIIDVDILYYDDVIFKSDFLEIPHPRMHERCFVLIPLCDIGPEVIHPVKKKRADELLNSIEETQKVIPLDEEASSEIFY